MTETSETQPAGSHEPADLASLFSHPAVAARLQQASPTSFRAAARFWETARSPGALEPRMKELILLALHGTITALNSGQIERHVKRAIAAGATEVEVLDVMTTLVGVANHALYFALPVLMKELENAQHPEAELPPINEQTQALKDDFIRKRGFWNEQRDIVARAMPEYFAALSEISTEAWVNGRLTLKERELICIAIDCSVTHMFEPGLAIHIRNALKQGASRDEILEVFALASATGLEGYIAAAETLFR